MIVRLMIMRNDFGNAIDSHEYSDNPIYECNTFDRDLSLRSRSRFLRSLK